jgi:squalene-associated FAD-dependent desaturase
MSVDERDGGARVVIVGGGLAGMAAAVALSQSGCRVQLVEARRTLGGRATSFRDPATGELIDHCQHVGMGCCTNLIDFCRRTGIDDLFRRDRTLLFIGPNGERCRFGATPGLPAPLHLASSFWGLKYLSARDRLAIMRAVWRLARLTDDEAAEGRTIGEWLVEQGQSPEAIEQFWSVVLVSALGEQLDRASLAAARKVIVDGFLVACEAYEVDIPQAPLGTVYDQRVASWFAKHGVDLRLGTAARRVTCVDTTQVELADGEILRGDFVILALPWHRIAEVVAPDLAARLPWLAGLAAIESAPITGVHLWFDREITPLAHAVLVGRLSQWMFNRGRQAAEGSGEQGRTGHYYQVVISASRNLTGMDRDAIARQVHDELAAIWPAAAEAKLLHWRVVTEHAAVFSVRPGIEALRPSQQTEVNSLLVAGDWTATGWPATMEGAVRSGYQAAEAILARLGRPRRWLAPDLEREWLARMLIR